ncbi:Aquaporin NIP1-2, variant 3 [Stylosanthes scabra]|uniref:Aquaporin NIP1-2, variant 3 n=1 Tax=Stylosanthes scabra TaxID=79078 RepID=A0ABU6Z1F8_9FABA|nr:Aquaporin NIP1-2, variant 3 [Stylosanthes scabra]
MAGTGTLSSEETKGGNNNNEVLMNIDNDTIISNKQDSSSSQTTSIPVSFLQKLVAEVVGTYFLIFAGCAAVVVNKNHDNVVTLPGISIVWGLAVTVLVYSTGHISGAHFNPAVTIAFATTRRFPFKQWIYLTSPILGAITGAWVYNALRHTAPSPSLRTTASFIK